MMCFSGDNYDAVMMMSICSETAILSRLFSFACAVGEGLQRCNRFFLYLGVT